MNRSNEKAMSLDNVQIHPIEPQWDAETATIIRHALIEFGANRPGFAWQDPELDHLSQAYVGSGKGYWVALLEGTVVGGVGIGPVQPRVKGVAELQKLYLRADVRGRGIGSALIDHALAFASQHYKQVYLESLHSMQAAAELYRTRGFKPLSEPLVITEHGGCDLWMMKTFTAAEKSAAKQQRGVESF